MNEYMLRVLNRGDHQKDWPKERHVEFVKKCEVYIGELQKAGKLIAAQPLRKQGLTLSKSGDAWAMQPLSAQGEMQVGYYHIRAENIDDAVAIAKRNPEFDYSATARVEVRPITQEEAITSFVYPSGK